MSAPSNPGEPAESSEQQRSSGDDPSRPEAEAVEAVFAQYLAECEAATANGGPLPDFEQVIADHPELEVGLRQMESDWEGFDSLLHGAVGDGRLGTLFHRSPFESQPPRQFLEFTPDRLIGGYRLIQRIGQGGMGEVWRAEHIALRRQVALKFIRPDRQSERSLAYFDREARASARLSHPNIVTVYEVGSEGELNWIAQELVHGSSTLKDFLRKVSADERLAADYFDRVARFVAEVLDALQYAHERGVIHRDVKPQNVLVTKEDRPKLTDFGLARLVDEAALSESQAVKGTPIYMSPEQVLGQSRLIDHRADVYGMGAVLYELLTLQRPFEGESGEVMKRVLEGEPRNPTEVRPEVPADLGAIALRALERRPSDRYRTAANMAEDLRRFLAREPVHARPPGPLRGAAKWVRRHPTLATAAIAAVLLATTTLGLQAKVRQASERLKETLVNSAWRAIAANDLGGAELLLDECAAEFPGDARPHLVMAAGYASRMRVADMERALARASELGGAAAGLGSAALDEFVEGLRLVASEGRSGHAKAIERIEGALEANPDLGADYLLFYLYGSEDPRALEALRKYRGTLKTSDPMVELVDAFELDLTGQHAEAADKARRLAERIGPQEFSKLHGDRELGRFELRAFQADSGRDRVRLERADEALTRSVELNSDDVGSLGLLSLVRMLQHDLTPNAGRRRELLAQAKELAQRSLAIEPDNPTPLETLVNVELAGLAPGYSAEAEARLHELLEPLERVHPGSRVARLARATVLHRRGTMLRDEGRIEDARNALLESVRLDPLTYQSQLGLGEIEYLDRRDYSAALAAFQAADRSLSEAEARLGTTWANDRFGIQVWAFLAADRAGELEWAYEYRELATRALEQDGLVATSVLNLAEGLSMPAHEELRDCTLASRLIRDHSLWKLTETRPEAAGILSAIEQACAE